MILDRSTRCVKHRNVNLLDFYKEKENEKIVTNGLLNLYRLILSFLKETFLLELYVLSHLRDINIIVSSVNMKAE